jgi:xylogalacturonan beta-1,3-xylosyltransferase
MLDLLLCPYQQKKLNPAKHWKRSLMATFNSSAISFLLLSALVSTLFFLCLSPLNQTIRISTPLSSLYSPNYSIEEAKSNHTFERFQSFPSPTTTVGDEEISARKDKVKLVWWF